ncbi:hypothetical protein [Cellulomonas aerilata]|uniref:Uncharacterized protein n=1 Tax=Cellulomonas aerilata TaxID=515326 RepID=A0A512D9Y2_9CELL|nr:hypothetical protein [Cellulomonas aerilata]GEO33279.1 hypothetical protein CAE01nite_10040 [Cellulomonas aerilata]
MAPDSPTAAQQAVNVVAAVMAGQPHDDVAAALQDWLDRRGAHMSATTFRVTVEAIVAGSSMVILAAPAPHPAPGPTTRAGHATHPRAGHQPVGRQAVAAGFTRPASLPRP